MLLMPHCVGEYEEVLKWCLTWHQKWTMVFKLNLISALLWAVFSKHSFTKSLPPLAVKIHFYTTKKLQHGNLQLGTSSEIKLSWLFRSLNRVYTVKVQMVKYVVNILVILINYTNQLLLIITVYFKLVN